MVYLTIWFRTKHKKKCTVYCTFSWGNIRSKEINKSLHCISAVSQQVSLKLFGWMAGLKTAGRRWRKSWMACDSALPPCSFSPFCLCSSHHHSDTCSPHIFAFLPQTRKATAKVADWHKCDTGLVCFWQKRKLGWTICISTREAAKA